MTEAQGADVQRAQEGAGLHPPRLGLGCRPSPWNCCFPGCSTGILLSRNRATAHCTVPRPLLPPLLGPKRCHEWQVAASLPLCWEEAKTPFTVQRFAWKHQDK